MRQLVAPARSLTQTGDRQPGFEGRVLGTPLQTGAPPDAVSPCTGRHKLPLEGPTGLHLLYCDDIAFMFGPDGEVYVEGQFPYLVWRRYLKTFQTIRIVGRETPLPAGMDASRLNRSSGPGVSFVPVPNLSGPIRLVRQYRTAADRLRQAMADRDAVIVRLPSQTGLLAASVAQTLGKPWAAEVVGCPWDQFWYHGSWQAKAFAPVQWARMRHTVAASRYTLYVTRAFLQRRYPTLGTTTVVSNVEIPEPDPAVLDARLRRIGTPRERMVLGLIGSIKHKYKGIGTAIEALARVRDRLPDFELRVLGQGDPTPWQAAAHRHGLADRIRFCGVRPSGQPVLDWLDEIDLYLQPSFQEGLPRTLVEAMSRACPAVASTAGGIPELLPPACLHRPGDAARLATLLLDAAHDSAWQACQAERNFDEAKQYVRTILDARRTDFWRCFAGGALSQMTARDA